MQHFRELSEQAVAAGGLHIAKGGQLWDIYRYEAAVARLDVSLASRLWQPVACTSQKAAAVEHPQVQGRSSSACHALYI